MANKMRKFTKSEIIERGFITNPLKTGFKQVDIFSAGLHVGGKNAFDFITKQKDIETATKDVHDNLDYLNRRHFNKKK